MTGKRQSHEELDAHHFHRGWRHVEHGGLAAEGDLPVEGRPSRPKGGGDLAVEGLAGRRPRGRRRAGAATLQSTRPRGRGVGRPRGRGQSRPCGRRATTLRSAQACHAPHSLPRHTHLPSATPRARAPAPTAAHTALPLAHTHLLLPPCPLTAAPSATVPLGNPLPPTRACASTLPARICIDEPPPRLVTCSIAATMPRPPRPREGVDEFQLRGGVRLVKPPVVHRIVEDAPPRDALSCRR